MSRAKQCRSGKLFAGRSAYGNVQRKAFPHAGRPAISPDSTNPTVGKSGDKQL
ncbi:MAG TPA: hypothetical protein VHS31_08410 [Tepidisphaeraceae bacterium]|nr:hypothetical protein [Tepidisphaeraceae bacterium]